MHQIIWEISVLLGFAVQILAGHSSKVEIRFAWMQDMDTVRSFVKRLVDPYAVEEVLKNRGLCQSILG